MKRKVTFKTLGCRLNQFETDALVTQFSQAGYEVVPFGQHADVTIINTCTVTSQSDHKSRNYISQAGNINPEGLLVVAGCMANNHREKLEKNQNITYVVENEHKSSVFSLVDGHFRGEIVHPDSLPTDRFGFETVEKSLHTRTSIKIQDGCDNFCSFCIIPKVRGRAVSRPVKDILDNIRKVTDNGFKELVLTGVNIGRYDFEGIRFENLLEKILELPGDFRLRISSIEPDGFTSDFRLLFQNPRLAPHLHLCLQSGSDEILLKMRRMYTVSSFMDVVSGFKALYPEFNFTTDVITGFPGESDKDFEQTCELIKEAGFSHVHTFRYSARKGTRAERMPDQVPEKVKTMRAEKIRQLSEDSMKAYLEKMKGKKQRVLIERVSKDGYASGYGEHYIPVRIQNKLLSRNSFVHIKLSDILEKGEMIGFEV